MYRYKQIIAVIAFAIIPLLTIGSGASCGIYRPEVIILFRHWTALTTLCYFGEEVVAFVIDEDESGEVFNLVEIAQRCQGCPVAK